MKSTLIAAPSALGLSPDAQGLERGTWQGADILLQTGLLARFGQAVTAFGHPAYRSDPPDGSRMRNGPAIRETCLRLADVVERAWDSGTFPVVLGGDCSILLGCLVALGRSGGRGLMHIDGHSDFTHAGNADLTMRPGNVAGMDLALATGRGEALLTLWDRAPFPLVKDEDAYQLGEREEAHPQFYADLHKTGIERLTIQSLLRVGIDKAIAHALGWLDRRNITQGWLHVDLDVLDQTALPAVDDPGSPGLDPGQLRQLLIALLATGRFIGVDFTIYDPTLDPDRHHAPMLAGLIADAISALPDDRHPATATAQEG